MRSSDIYINERNLDTYERSETFRRSNVPPERFAQTDLANVPGKPSLFKTEVVTRRHLGFGKKNITKLKMLKKCDHCKKHHELYLNYNSENISSLWADMMEKDLNWNKRQNLDDENQKATHNIES